MFQIRLGVHFYFLNVVRVVHLLLSVFLVDRVDLLNEDALEVALQLLLRVSELLQLFIRFGVLWRNSLEDRMFESLLHRYPLLAVESEHFVDQVLDSEVEVFWEQVGYSLAWLLVLKQPLDDFVLDSILKGLWRCSEHLDESLVLSLVLHTQHGMRRKHLEEVPAQLPNFALLVVLLQKEFLWSSINFQMNLLRQLLILTLDYGGQAKVRQASRAVGIQQNVVRLNVSVLALVVLESLESLQNLINDIDFVLQVKALVFFIYHLQQVSVPGIEDHEQRQISVDNLGNDVSQSDYVWVVEMSHYVQLSNDMLFEGICVQLLDCNPPAWRLGLLIFKQRHYSVGALPK